MNDDTAAVHDLAAVYALDALPPDEATAFEAHLATCAACTEEVASLQEVTADLAGMTETAPPPELRASVLDAITDLEQVAAPTAGATGATNGADPDEGESSTVVSIRPDATDPPPEDHDARADQAEPMAQVVPLADYRRARSTTRILTGIAAALVLVAGALGVWAGDLSGQVDDLSGQVGDLDQQVVALDSQLQDREAVAAQVTSVLNAPDAELINETGSSLILSADQGRAVFAPGALSAPGEDQVLQMWVIDDSGATSAGLVEDPTTPTLLEIPVPEGAIVGVTAEPSGGSDQPTSDPLVAFAT
ncbi:anti-sigma factor [Salsipaludibacter albus]|uniref:anti-sigma factor n=1 Tax=Salsipaludibacter albus TaxID=2849650 RepID=UPI001EE4B2E2|nr:anti-sigma factor [Salsipaludibacter albus]MBY5164214.1 anti-sigma factor [Salsipaludibacter albus]